MRFKDKNYKQDLELKIYEVAKLIINKVTYSLFKLMEFMRRVRKEYYTRDINRIRRRALRELIKRVEEELLHSKSELRVYKDADLDTSDISIKKEFSGFYSNLKICKRYYGLLLEIGEDLDLNYFYNAIVDHFKLYNDLQITEKIDKAWEKGAVWARDLEYIEIIKEDDYDK